MDDRMDYDIERVRAAFPALADGTAYFDGPGGSQVPREVADAIAGTMLDGLSNRGAVTASERRADDGPLVASVRVVRAFGSSRIEQDIVLRAGSARLDFVTRIDWHENEKVLKAAMPVDVHADRAACEIQFGTVERPTHASGS